jgi:cytochrome P450
MERRTVTGPDPYFNPLDPGIIEDPYPAYARLRAQRPVHWHEGMGLWLVAGYRDCAAVTADHVRFASDYRRAGVAEDPNALSVQTLDPPAQPAVRRLLAAAVKSLDPARLEATARASASAVLASASASGVADFASDVAMPFALASAAAAFGIGPGMGEHLADVRRITDSFLPALRPELVRPGSDARLRLGRVLAAAYDAGAETGIINYVRGSPWPESIPRDLLINSLRVTFMSIVNSTGRFFCLGLRALLAHSSLRNFGAARSPVHAAHELVRFDTSFQVQERICVTDTTIGGIRIARGDRVALLYGSANRDETVFAEPDRLMLGRSPNPHLGFGRGTHSCLGSPIAISLSAALFETMAKHYPETALAGRVVMEDNPASRGVRSMPVRLTPHQSLT